MDKSDYIIAATRILTLTKTILEKDKRIAELEAREIGWVMTLSTMEAEIVRLREASERVLSALLPGKVVHMGHEHVRYSATYSIAGWNPVLELQALLGGGGK